MLRANAQSTVLVVRYVVGSFVIEAVLEGIGELMLWRLVVVQVWNPGILLEELGLKARKFRAAEDRYNYEVLIKRKELRLCEGSHGGLRGDVMVGWLGCRDGNGWGIYAEGY